MIRHHIVPQALGRDDDPDNLLVLCRLHASLADRGHLVMDGRDRSTLRVVVEPVASSEAVRRMQQRYEEEKTSAMARKDGGGP